MIGTFKKKSPSHPARITSRDVYFLQIKPRPFFVFFFHLFLSGVGTVDQLSLSNSQQLTTYPLSLQPSISVFVSLQALIFL